jgi:hypothetical protein
MWHRVALGAFAAAQREQYHVVAVLNDAFLPPTPNGLLASEAAEEEDEELPASAAAFGPEPIEAYFEAAFAGLATEDASAGLSFSHMAHF